MDVFVIVTCGRSPSGDFYLGIEIDDILVKEGLEVDSESRLFGIIV